MSAGSRYLSTLGSRLRLHITTPIFYVNAEPHLGHAHTMVLADVYARWKRKQCNSTEVTLSTGTDEHGQKVWQAAEGRGVETASWCDSVAARFRAVASALAISHSDFIRTTEKRHAVAVEALWKRLYAGNHIYKGTHEGWYGVADEAFYRPQDVHEGRAIETGRAVEWVSEENYKFRLHRFVPEIRKWLETGAIQPANRAHDLLPFLAEIERSCMDLSVSRRCKGRASQWGIPVPGDNEQLIYVWLDALTSYLTAQGFPSASGSFGEGRTVHVIGKDILKFHAVYWPAFLLAAGLPLPHQILVHGHWLMSSGSTGVNEPVKMSKSIGNVVHPEKLLADWGFRSPDPLRYFLMKSSRLGSDSMFSTDALLDVYNGDFTDKLGNLVSRCFNQRFLSVMAPLDSIDDDDAFEKLEEAEERLARKSAEHYEQLVFHQVIEDAVALLSALNSYVSIREPWRLQGPKLRAVLRRVGKALHAFSAALDPIIPDTCKDLENVVQNFFQGGTPLLQPLFPRINKINEFGLL